MDNRRSGSSSSFTATWSTMITNPNNSLASIPNWSNTPCANGSTVGSESGAASTTGADDSGSGADAIDGATTSSASGRDAARSRRACARECRFRFTFLLPRHVYLQPHQSCPGEPHRNLVGRQPQSHHATRQSRSGYHRVPTIIAPVCRSPGGDAFPAQHRPFVTKPGGDEFGGG